MFPDLKIHNKISADAGLARCRVWCLKCRHTRMVRRADCLRDGWPRCCGETMTVDDPETPTA